MNRKKRLAILAGSVLVAGGLAVGFTSGVAKASTHGCDIALNGCRSIQSEVPNRPDLDVQGGAKVVGNAIIVYTRSSTDKAEDWVPVAHAGSDTSTVAVTGVNTLTTATTLTSLGFTNAVSLEFAPNGVRSGLCLSSVNPNGFASTQLRVCNTVASKFNPWQTFKVDDTGVFDGQFVKYIEPINNRVLTNPRNDGYIGTVGHRIQTKFANDHSFTGQLWGKNNS
jgi:hypothetical protein